METQASPTFRSPPSERLIRGHQIAVAVIVIALGLGVTHLYVWLVGHSVISTLAMALGLPYLGYRAFKLHAAGDRIATAWTVGAVILLLFVARTAVIDAHQLHYANCWRINGDSTSSTWECAPGRSEPAHWASSYDPNSDQETPGNYCDFVNSTSSGGTIWHCTSG